MSELFVPRVCLKATLMAATALAGMVSASAYAQATAASSATSGTMQAQIGAPDQQPQTVGQTSGTADDIIVTGIRAG